DYSQVDGATLVFRANETASGFGGIFTTNVNPAASGPFGRVVDTTSQLPDFGSVQYLNNFLFATGGGYTVFQAHDRTGKKTALFLAASGTIIKIAGSGDVAGDYA